MTPGRKILAFPALAGACVALIGCGSDSSGSELSGEPFSTQERDDFIKNLDEIDGLVIDGDCDGAESKLAAVTEAAQNVPAERDEQLVADLLTLLGDLDEQIATECSGNEETSTISTTSTDEDEDPTTSTTTSTEATTASTTEETSTTETEEETPTVPEETVPPEETPGNSPVTPPGQSGGSGPSPGGGISPEKGFESGRNGRGYR